MVKEIKISDLDSSKKLILTLKEYETIHFVGEKLQILNDDKDLEQFLIKKKIEMVETKKGIRISVGPYIGSAEFSNFIVTVNPKFTQLKNIGKIIDYAYDLKDEDILDYEIKFHEEEDNPMELIIQIFINQSKKLVQKGLIKTYQIHQETVPFMRGKLLLQQQIKNQSKLNLDFSCEFDEFTENIIENQIILFTLEKCYHMTSSNHRKSTIKKIIHQMDAEVELKPIEIQDFNKVQYTRLNSQYKKPHNLSKLILKHLGLLDFKKQSASFVVPYFIPMYQVFEDFLTKLFEDYYALKIQKQRHTPSWKVNGSNRNIIPDIITYNTKSCKEGSEVAIIDAKYMVGSKFGEGKEDYQIAFYLNDYKKKIGYAILPLSQDSKEDIQKDWIAPNQDLRICVRFVDIDKILDLVYSKENNSKQISEKLEAMIPIVLENN
jgi:5-methylcytosine-specific restriction endonuclease McrBC regulatory subunit McrC